MTLKWERKLFLDIPLNNQFLLKADNETITEIFLDCNNEWFVKDHNDCVSSFEKRKHAFDYAEEINKNYLDDPHDFTIKIIRPRNRK